MGAVSTKLTAILTALQNDITLVVGILNGPVFTELKQDIAFIKELLNQPKMIVNTTSLTEKQSDPLHSL